jgi:hypothetical protein
VSSKIIFFYTSEASSLLVSSSLYALTALLLIQVENRHISTSVSIRRAMITVCPQYLQGTNTFSTNPITSRFSSVLRSSRDTIGLVVDLGAGDGDCVLGCPQAYVDYKPGTGVPTTTSLPYNIPLRVRMQLIPSAEGSRNSSGVRIDKAHR